MIQAFRMCLLEDAPMPAGRQIRNGQVVGTDGQPALLDLWTDLGEMA